MFCFELLYLLERGGRWGRSVGNRFSGWLHFFWLDGRKYLSYQRCVFAVWPLLALPYLHMSLFLLPLRLRYPMVWSVDVDRSAYVLVLFTPDMNEREEFFDAFK